MFSRINRFLFSVDSEDHFQGTHQVILLKITLNHFPILLQVKEVFAEVFPGRCMFKFENVA